MFNFVAVNNFYTNLIVFCFLFRPPRRTCVVNLGTVDAAVLEKNSKIRDQSAYPKFQITRNADSGCMHHSVQLNRLFMSYGRVCKIDVCVYA